MRHLCWIPVVVWAHLEQRWAAAVVPPTWRDLALAKAGWSHNSLVQVSRKGAIGHCARVSCGESCTECSGRRAEIGHGLRCFARLHCLSPSDRWPAVDETRADWSIEPLSQPQTPGESSEIASFVVSAGAAQVLSRFLLLSTAFRFQSKNYCHLRRALISLQFRSLNIIPHTYLLLNSWYTHSR